VNFSALKTLSIRMVSAYAIVLPVASYPVLFAYFHNAGEARLSQAWLPLGVFVGVAALFLLLFSLISSDAIKGAFVANVALFLFSYYRPIEDFLREINWHIRYWHVVPVLMVCLVLFALQLTTDKRRRPDLRDVFGDRMGVIGEEAGFETRLNASELPFGTYRMGVMIWEQGREVAFRWMPNRIEHTSANGVVHVALP
jgi:hypothetical protein